MIRVVDLRYVRNAEELAAVCYIGLSFGRWLGSPWGNPFRVSATKDDLQSVLARFARYADDQPPEWLEDLWKACEHGKKPLGCWCTRSTHGDGLPLVCHGQILAGMLVRRFGPKDGAA